MPRLNIKSTKDAIIKLLKNEVRAQKAPAAREVAEYAEVTLLQLARELEIEIKPEEYK